MNPVFGPYGLRILLFVTVRFKTCRKISLTKEIDVSELFDSGYFEWEEVRHKATTKKRSEEHTSELQSPYDLVCRLLLEKKKIEQMLVCALILRQWGAVEMLPRHQFLMKTDVHRLFWSSMSLFTNVF